MVKIRIIFIWMVLFLSFYSYGQDIAENTSPSDSAYYCSFFPMHVGDKWVYKVDPGDGNAFYYYYEIVMDTVDSLNRHWFGWKSGNSDDLVFYTITDSFAVVSGSPDSVNTSILYKLNARPGDKWLINGDYEWGVVYEVNPGTDSVLMIFDEWALYNYEKLWLLRSIFLHRGIGLFQILEEDGLPTYLAGAIIDGVVYGNPTEIELEQITVIEDFHLFQNYPNPFNSVTTIPFYLSHKGKVYFNIYDILGRLIYSQNYCYNTAGYKTVVWDGTDQNNRPVPSGIYIYEVSTGENKMRIKMTLNK